MNILKNLQFSEQKPSTLVVSNSERQMTIAIGLMDGQVLKKHLSFTPALIVILKGSILIQMERKTVIINEFDTFEISASMPHEVTGLEESIFLLIKDKV
jgi:quercetin dioxygenase-like cupin family protein